MNRRPFSEALKKSAYTDEIRRTLYELSVKNELM